LNRREFLKAMIVGLLQPALPMASSAPPGVDEAFKAAAGRWYEIVVPIQMRLVIQSPRRQARITP